MKNSDLSHLSQTEQNHLIHRYEAGESTKALIEEYQLNCGPSGLWKLFPPEVLEISCPYCSEPLTMQRRSRSSLYPSSETALCPSCSHLNTNDCKCKNCLKKKKDMAAQLRERIEIFCRNGWIQRPQVLAVSELTFQEAAYLMSIVKTCGWKNEKSLYSISESGKTIAPFFHLENKILSLLQKQIFIYPDKNSPLEAFEIFDNFPTKILERKVEWGITIRNIRGVIKGIEKASSRKNWPKHWSSEVNSLLLNLAEAECLVVYFGQCKKHGINPDYKQARDLVENLFERFSIEEMKVIIKSGLKNFSMLPKNNHYNGADGVQTQTDSCMEFATDLSKNRIQEEIVSTRKKNSRSIFGHVLFDMFLGVGERGYHMSQTDLGKIAEPSN